MSGDTFEESLLKQGLSLDVVRVAVSMTRMLSSATSLDEAIREFCVHSKESMRYEATRLKWRSFSAEKIEEANDVGAIRSAYFNTPRGSPEEVCALRKWIAIAKTPEEILEVYWETKDLSEEQDLARDKLVVYFEDLIDTFKTAHA